MKKKQESRKSVVYGICTNTGGKEDGTPCSKCINKEKQAIRSSKDFVCEECGKRLTKIDYKPPQKWPIALSVTLAIIVFGIGAYFAFFRVSDAEETVTISLNKEVINFNVGECDTLVVDVTVYPSDANVSVSFTSDIADVAQVDGLGIVKAIAKGETTINVIARTKNGFEDTANVMVTVSENEKTVDKQNKVRKIKSSRISFGTLDGSIEYDNNATIKVTRQHTIKLKDAKQSIVTLYPGDVLKPCRIRKGVLESFQIIRQNGNRQSVVDSQEKLN